MIFSVRADASLTNDRFSVTQLIALENIAGCGLAVHAGAAAKSRYMGQIRVGANNLVGRVLYLVMSARVNFVGHGILSQLVWAESCIKLMLLPR